MKKQFCVTEVFPEIEWIQDKDIREKTIRVWERMWAEGVWDDIMDLPATVKRNYPHVIHNRSVLEVALRMAETFEKFHGAKVNRDHLISAALLQDSSKLVEFIRNEDGTISKTELGKTFPHAFYAAHVCLEEGLPYDIVQAVLDHTPDCAEFPPNLLIKILFYADQADCAAFGADRWKKTSMIYR